MPYDPRMMQQLGQMGVGMMSPQQINAFADPRSTQQPRQWWAPAVQVGQPANRSENMPDDQSARPKEPPSLYDMMLSLGRMTRPEYDKAIRGPGPYGIAPKDAARVSPMGFLGSLGMDRGPPR